MASYGASVSALYKLLYNPSFFPQRSPRCSVRTVESGPTTSFILNNTVTGDYYEIDDVTAAIWNLMDGSKSLTEIHQEVSKSFTDLTLRDVREVVFSLAQESALMSTEPERFDRPRVQVKSAFQVDVRVMADSSRNLLPVYDAFRPFFRRPVLVGSFVFALAGFVIFANSFFGILADKSNFQVLGSTLLGFLFYNLLILLPVYGLHEISHALACMHYGGKPGEIGTGLFYLSPMFYCDTTDSWRLGTWPRIMISMAGPLSTVIVGAVLALLSLFYASGYLKTVLQISAFFCFYGTYFNLSPVIENDGYYALADLLHLPNLREDSFAYLKRLAYRLLGRRSQTESRTTKKQRRVYLLFSLFAGGWLALFVYSTATITVYLAQDAAGAAIGIGHQFLLRAFDPVVIGAGVASIAYFGLLMSGYGILGRSLVKRLRSKRVRLQTIHDRSVSIFMPLPSSLSLGLRNQLLSRAKGMANKFSRQNSVSWDPPFCVANLSMGRAQQSLEALKANMQEVERGFRRMFTDFLAKNQRGFQESAGIYASGKLESTNLLKRLSEQISGYSGSEAKTAIHEFLIRQQKNILYLMHSAMSSVWVLELSPEDYKRMQTTIFPALLAEDLSRTDLYGDVEDFKKRTILGLDTIATLAAQLDQEVGEVHKKLGKYQATAFVEPIRSRLVLVGRTEELRKAQDKFGRLFLAQVWSGYFDDALKEAVLGLLVVRRAPIYSLSKLSISKLHDKELLLLKENLRTFASLEPVVTKAVGELKVGHEESVKSLEEIKEIQGPMTEDFDVGFLDSIMKINLENLDSVMKRVETLEEEFTKLSRELKRIRELVEAEVESRGRGTAPSHGFFSRRNRGIPTESTPAFDAVESLILAASQALFVIVVTTDLLTAVSSRQSKVTSNLNTRGAVPQL
ncbi:MAG: PqqD family peptide modification chaperone [Thaumarchaeota archaeon]|nr:PqqD family peptide modification chaperone [Nitrososphaerota archaeon]